MGIVDDDFDYIFDVKIQREKQLITLNGENEKHEIKFTLNQEELYLETSVSQFFWVLELDCAAIWDDVSEFFTPVSH